MNTIYRLLAPGWVSRWEARARPVGFALYQPARRRGIAPRGANAHARFEQEARQALREWLML